MDVLWGAWAKEVRYNEQARTHDIIGIYDTIYKERKSDYPFYLDLYVVLVCYASPAEYGLSSDVTLDLIDEDAVNHLFTHTEPIDIPAGDSPQRWFEQFELKGVGFDEPGHYSLSVLIEKQEKHSIPLWVISPKGITWDEEKGTKTEFWAEDFKQLKDEGKI